MGIGSDDEKKVKINEYGEIADTQTSGYGNTNNVPWDQFYCGLEKKVEEKYDELKKCNDWSGRGSVYHENWNDYSLGENWTFSGKCCNADNPYTIKEYLAQDGFDVVRDLQDKAWYVSKSNSYYIVLDGCLDIIGSGPHKQEIENLVRGFLEFKDVKKWESRSVKITESEDCEGCGISVVGKDGFYIDRSTRSLNEKYITPSDF